jgi:hypothetical protein
LVAQLAMPNDTEGEGYDRYQKSRILRAPGMQGDGNDAEENAPKGWTGKRARAYPVLEPIRNLEVSGTHYPNGMTLDDAETFVERQRELSGAPPASAGWPMAAEFVSPSVRVGRDNGMLSATTLITMHMHG